MKNPPLKRLSRHLRSRWRTRALAAHGVAIVALTKNGLLAVQPGDFNVSRALLERGEYDWQPILWLQRLLPPGARLIFAGAHIGALLVPLALSCPGCEVLAFEPSPNNFRLLSMNLALNGLHGVQARNVALGATPGRAGFTENRINTGNSRVTHDAGALQVDLQALDREVPAGWTGIDLLVMDVEGSEVAAMRGAPDTLRRTRYLYVEFAPEQLREQNASATEFIEVVSGHFRSAYLITHSVRYLGPGEFATHLTGLQHHPGLLLNVLFSQDAAVNPVLVGTPA